jgi:hypothetical protein
VYAKKYIICTFHLQAFGKNYLRASGTQTSVIATHEHRSAGSRNFAPTRLLGLAVPAGTDRCTDNRAKACELQRGLREDTRLRAGFAREMPCWLELPGDRNFLAVIKLRGGHQAGSPPDGPLARLIGSTGEDRH